MRHHGARREKDPWVMEVERTLGYRFRNASLLRAALTHSSAGEEGKGFGRLEFLGDAVLGLLTTLHVYRHYPQLSAGDLTRIRAGIVNRTVLAQAATQLGLHSMVRLGKSEEPGGRRRPTILSGAFEAFVGALFLDRGTGTVTKFLEEHLLPLLSPGAPLDPKSELQNLIQASLKTPPRYRVIQHWGPPHARRFEVAVEVRGKQLGQGRGESRGAAERAAAQDALAFLEANHNILGPGCG